MIGFTENELRTLAEDSKLDDLRKVPFWSAEVYGFGSLIRNYGFYPSFLPLYVHTDHGPTQVDWPIKSHLNSNAPIHFFHSRRLADRAEEMINRKCYSLYSPFVYYRRKNNIKKSIGAKGTIAFPSHSTHHIDAVLDYEKYIEDLLCLPEEFQPVSVCLYFLDIQKNRHVPFMKKGIPVYTAGDWLNQNFTKRFYNIVKDFKYSTSNSVGSYSFYCVEMGIPFYLHGDAPAKRKISDNDVFNAAELPSHERVQALKTKELFSEIKTFVSDDQKEYVERELGVYSGVGRIHMAYLLYYALLRVLLKKIFKFFSN